MDEFKKSEFFNSDGSPIKHFMGSCRFCGQFINIDGGAKSGPEADNIASEVCECSGAKEERHMKARIAKGQGYIDKLFGEQALESKVIPLAASSVNMLHEAVEATVRGYIDRFMLRVPDICKAEISITGKGRLRVKRGEGISLEMTE